MSDIRDIRTARRMTLFPSVEVEVIYHYDDAPEEECPRDSFRVADGLIGDARRRVKAVMMPLEETMY